MSDETDDEKVRNPRPESYDHPDVEWFYVPEKLAQTVSLGPVSPFNPEDDDWILSFSSAVPDEHPNDAEEVNVRLDPRTLHELYIETKGLSVDQRQAGHSGECALCGEQVDLDEAWPDGEGRPTHRDCWADAYQEPLWWGGNIY